MRIQKHIETILYQQAPLNIKNESIICRKLILCIQSFKGIIKQKHKSYKNQQYLSTLYWRNGMWSLPKRQALSHKHNAAYIYGKIHARDKFVTNMRRSEPCLYTRAHNEYNDSKVYRNVESRDNRRLEINVS